MDPICGHKSNEYRTCSDCLEIKCKLCITKCYHCKEFMCVIHNNKCLCKNPVCKKCFYTNKCHKCYKDICPKNDYFCAREDDLVYCGSCSKQCPHCDKYIYSSITCKTCFSPICKDCDVVECMCGRINICTKEGKSRQWDSHDGYYTYFPDFYKVKTKDDDENIITKLMCDECCGLHYECKKCNKKIKTLYGICVDCIEKCKVCNKYLHEMHETTCDICQENIHFECALKIGWNFICKDRHGSNINKCEGCYELKVINTECPKGHKGCEECIFYGLGNSSCKICKKKPVLPECEFKIHYDDYEKQENFENTWKGYYKCTNKTASIDDTFCQKHKDFLKI